MTVNKTFHIGNLGADPDCRTTTGGSAITEFSIGCNEVWYDKVTGERKEHVEWVLVKTWGKQADACAEFLKTGRQVHVEGKMRTDSWEDKETGKKRYKTFVKADKVTFLGGKDKQENGGDSYKGQDDIGF